MVELNKGSLLSEELISFPCNRGSGSVAFVGHGVKTTFRGSQMRGRNFHTLL